jgi:zinc transporter ZupT
MDTQSPDARALIWTGLSMAVIIIGAAIAYAVFA